MLNLRPHQEQALQDLGNGRILWGGVGTGKSRVAVTYYQKHHWGKPVIVITTAKKRDSLDWVAEFANIGITKDPVPDVSTGYLIVDSWNNLEKYAHRTDCFFIFDEQRLVGNGTWSKIFIKLGKRNPWILLSATPGDTWLDYIPVFLANGFYKNRTEFVREHVVYAPYVKFPKVERYVNVNKLVKLRNSLLVHMPYERETVRHSKTIWVDYDADTMERVTKDRWHVFENRPIRDVAELFLVMRKVVNGDRSRLRAVDELLKRHKRLIVFYTFDYELELLREFMGRIPFAEWNGHKHEAIPDTEKWLYVVQYTAGAEGWNCISTDAMCFFDLTYSYKLWEQAHGRIDRLNTPFKDLWYYVLRSRAVIDMSVWRTLLGKKSFNERGFNLDELKWG